MAGSCSSVIFVSGIFELLSCIMKLMIMASRASWLAPGTNVLWNRLLGPAFYLLQKLSKFCPLLPLNRTVQIPFPVPLHKSTHEFKSMFSSLIHIIEPLGLVSPSEQLFYRVFVPCVVSLISWGETLWSSSNSHDLRVFVLLRPIADLPLLKDRERSALMCNE